jgi:tryptophan-rich sensory protein
MTSLGKILGLLGWLSLAFLTAAVGAAASVNAGTFYSVLLRPSWAPPAWLFGPVWTTLYFLMGISAWLVWMKSGLTGGRSAFSLFILQLVVNALWSWLFFQWREGALAFVDVVLLWFLIVATIVAFWRIRKSAAVMLVPYLAWVTFASILTFAVWQRNPALLG